MDGFDMTKTDISDKDGEKEYTDRTFDGFCLKAARYFQNSFTAVF